MVLSALLLLGCQEKDDLYGVSADDYVPGSGDDAAASRYHEMKRAACYDIKSAFSPESGWVSVSLIEGKPNGEIAQRESTGNVFANLRFNYEASDGGIMRVSTINRLGYRKDFTLYPCNEKDAYFYVADYAADGTTLLGILAFSIDPKTFPSAPDLGHELGLSTNSTVIGLAVTRGGPSPDTVVEVLDDVHYLGYLMRQKACTSTTGNDPSFLNNLQNWMFRLCTSGTINGRPLDRFSSYLTFHGENGAVGQGVQIYYSRYDFHTISDVYRRFAQERPVYVYQSGRLVDSFRAWVSPNKGVVPSRIDIRI